MPYYSEALRKRIIDSVRQPHKNVMITRRYEFSSAHWLPLVPDGHRCKEPHGHNYTVDVCILGEVGQDGMLIDFFEVDKIVQPILDEVDHKTLNSVKGLENPTVEIIALWFLEQLTPRIGVSFIRVHETADCWADVCN